MNNIIQWLERLSVTVSVELFVIVGCFLEEIIAPIPSPFVMSTVAVIAKQQSYGLEHLVLVAVLGAAAKTVASYFIYLLADKGEDFIFTKFKRLLPVSHAQIEAIGKYLTGTWWDDALLFIARAMPIVSTSVVSVAAGVIKYPMRSYLLMTFLGNIVRNGFFIWVGYVGWGEVERVWRHISGNPVLITLGVASLFAVIFLAFKTKDRLWTNIIKKHPR